MKPTIQPTLLHRLAAVIGCFYLRLVALTTSLQIHGMAASDRQIIYAVWHDQQAFPIYYHRGRKITALASKSRDGEYAAGILRKLGYATVRGSTSSGAFQSLIQLIRCAGRGLSLALTPDGPRGPRHKVQKGVIYLAQKTGLPVVGITVALSRKLSAHSWDRFQVPLPFGRAVMVYSAPIHISKEDQPAAKAEELEKIMNAACLRAEELLGSRS